jgi:FSR family fosmidomycin resistance protein-like MFS transporter
MSAAALPLQRDVRIISLIGVVHGVSHYYQLAFATMLLVVREKAGLSYGDVGALAAIFYAVSGVCQTAAGFAVDRFGARPILAGGLAMIGIGLALTAVANSFVFFAAIAVFAGIGNCVFHPADFAILNASVNANRLGRAYSIHGLGGSLGWAAAPAIYFLADAFGRTGAALIGAIPGLVLAVMVWTHRDHIVDHRAKVHAQAAQPGAKVGIHLFLQSSILLCFAYFSLVAINTVGIQQMAVPAFTEMYGVTSSYAALCLIVFVVGSAAGVLVGGFLADRFSRHDLVAAAGLLAAAALTVPIASLAVTPMTLLPVLALAGFAGGTTGPSRDMIVRAAAPQGASGKVFGFVYSGLDVGSFIGPPLFGHLMDLHMPTMIFWITAGLYVANTFMVMMVHQVSVRQARPAPAE